MKIEWLFFDLGNTIYDETLSDKNRIERLINNNSLNLSYEDFYLEMEKASSEYASSPFAAARKKFSIDNNELYFSDLEFLFPSVIDTIVKLSNKYKLGIIANQPKSTLQRLKNDGLYDYFDLCVLSECVGMSKPDLDIFEYAIKNSKCLPNRSAMIGDRLDNDIFPAKKLGFKTIRIKQGLSANQKVKKIEYKPDYEISEFTQLLEIF